MSKKTKEALENSIEDRREEVFDKNEDEDGSTNV